MATHSVSQSPDDGELPLPLDLSHHWSLMSKHRTPSKMKAYYKFFQIPGVGNLAGGLPNVRFFPFDTLEAQAAKPDRWPPTLDESARADSLAGKLAAASLSDDPQAASHIAVPKVGTETDPIKNIDLGTALQYGQASGYPPLHSWIRQLTREHLHPNVPYRGGVDVSMTVGSTDGMSKVADLLYDLWFEERGDDIRDRPGILCDEFCYMSAINQVTIRGAQVVPVKNDGAGVLAKGPGSLEDVLANWDYSKGRRPHMIYIVTMGHNPTGYVMQLERRQEVYDVCSKYDVIILEDDPYWILQFPSAEIEEAKSRGLPIPEVKRQSLPKTSGYPFLDSLAPSFLNIDVDGRVIRLDTFSKTVAPGCRLGWVTAQPAFIEKIVRIAETGTQQPSGFVQSLIAELVLGPQTEAKAAFGKLRTRKEQAEFSGWKLDGWVRWLEGLRGMYERRMNRMCTILDEGSYQIKTGTPVREADADWGVVTKTQILEYEWPRGGMFVWVRVNLEHHPLFKAIGSDGAVIPPVSLTTALMLFLTTKPYLVVASVGLMFSATNEIAAEKGWAYYRLCFAAESEERVDLCSQRFVDGVHKFFRIKDVRILEGLLKDLELAEARSADEGVSDMGLYLGC